MKKNIKTSRENITQTQLTINRMHQMKMIFNVIDENDKNDRDEHFSRSFLFFLFFSIKTVKKFKLRHKSIEICFLSKKHKNENRCILQNQFHIFE